MRWTYLIALLVFSFSCSAQNYYLFVGTYTSGKSEGIYVYEFNASTGKIKPLGSVKSKDPSYLAIAPNGKYLYAVNENGNDKMGGISAFSFDRTKGQLHLINQRASGGSDPCYVSVDRTGRWVVVANYSGGSLSALKIESNGGLDSLAQLIQHQGNSINQQRQEKAHVHSVVFAPDEHFLLAADLGMDRESIYRFSPAKPQPLTASNDSFVATPAGSGPRHLVFDSKGNHAYLIEELSGTIDAYNYKNGNLKSIQHISTHPADYKGIIGSADIHISPNGKFLYASNRGDANTITVFSIDSASGKLHLKGFQSTMGAMPRNFIIAPGGHFLLVANQASDNIVVFRINAVNGMLTPTGDNDYQ